MGTRRHLYGPGGEMACPGRSQTHTYASKLQLIILAVALAASLVLTGCSTLQSGQTTTTDLAAAAAPAPQEATSSHADAVPSASSVTGDAFLASLPTPAQTDLLNGYVTLNDNEPSFEATDATTEAFQEYAPLDALGRCGTAHACLGPETLPTEERGDIHDVHPSGWQSGSYAFVDGGSLFNRSHLIAFSLSGQNANECNLVTGTRHMNAEVMRPFEEMVADYIRQTGNHVLYRVTPVFSGSELVPRGLQMEARSMEDGGQGVELNVYLYNVQPGVEIDYATGENQVDSNGSPDDATVGAAARDAGAAPSAVASPSSENADAQDYVVNTNSKKFHSPDCPSVASMKEANRQDVHASASELEEAGYSPHKECVG